MNKTLKVMTSAALLAGVVAPVAVTTVSANSSNVVSKVVSLDDNYEWTTGAATTSIYINEDDVDFTSGDTFRLSLPSGVKWVTGQYVPGNQIAADTTDATTGFDVVSVTDYDLELKMVGTPGNFDKVAVPLFLKVDGADNGEVQLTVNGKDSTVTSSKYTIATISDGATNATIASKKTVGDGGAIDTIRIDETSVAAVYDKKYDTDPVNGSGAAAVAQKVKLKLPSDFEWAASYTAANVEFTGGFAGKVTGVSVDSATNKDELVLTFKFTSKPSSLGTIYLKNLAIDADKDAEYGDIEVDIDGSEVTSQSLVVAEYADYGTKADLEGDVPTLFAGRNNTDTEDLETVEVTIKEAIAGSWTDGKAVEIEFPSWAKVVGAEVTTAKNFKEDGSTDINGNGPTNDTLTNKEVAGVITAEIDGTDNVVEFDLPKGLKEDGKKEMKVKFFVSSQADASGDLTVKVGGKAGIEVGETTIAKVVSPVNVEVTKADVRTGIKSQPINDITITEATKGALIENGQVRIWLSDAEFTSEPKVEVVEGNLKIDEDSVNIDNNVLTFEIDSESTRASKIKISGLSLDLNRAIAEGDVTVKVGGSALVKNATKDYSGNDITPFNIAAGNDVIGDKTFVAADFKSGISVGEFDKDYVVKKSIATVVTPAEGNVSAETVTLAIGQGTMKVGDKEVALDAAPYIEASTGRTYLPLRAIANAIGASSVEWDNASRTATVIKGGLVAQMTIGQNAYVLNGAKIGMDGKAQIKSDRTFLPIRALGNALGAQVEWDAATQTVTIK